MPPKGQWIKDIGKRFMEKRLIEDYNEYLKSNLIEPINKRESYLVMSGIRIGRAIAEAVIEEKNIKELQKRLPITEEELKYYSTLTTPSQSLKDNQ